MHDKPKVGFRRNAPYNIVSHLHVIYIIVAVDCIRLRSGFIFTEAVFDSGRFLIAIGCRGGTIECLNEGSLVL